MLFMLVYVGHARVKPASFPDLLQQVYKLLSSCVQGTLVWTAWHMQKMRVSLPNASKILWKGISTSPPPSHHRPRSCQWKWKDFRLPFAAVLAGSRHSCEKATTPETIHCCSPRTGQPRFCLLKRSCLPCHYSSQKVPESFLLCSCTLYGCGSKPCTPSEPQGWWSSLIPHD